MTPAETGFLGNCFQIAVQTVLVYDHVLDIGDEISFIWTLVSTTPSLLYLLIRYWGHVVMICYMLFELQCWGMLGIAFAVQVLMILRVWAMNSRSKAIVGCLTIVFIAQAVVILVTIWSSIGPGTVYASVDPSGAACLIEGVRIRFVPAFGPILTFELLIFLFAVRGFVRNASTQSHDDGRLSLREVLIRDSFILFTINICLCAMSLTTWLVSKNHAMNALTVPFIPLLQITLGTRLVLNIRRQDVSNAQYSMTDYATGMMFADAELVDEFSVPRAGTSIDPLIESRDVEAR
ncbi:hypothetical protein CONPUDRAFT_92780 [Coniophora puteana RWD-64-598 SS2]|uniref:DUF6533 domain-containing protein n=1 Tax=Coniophora puteana (strain RWD-64-598) TaxID=741705 RepID=A0A5M3MD38_CONPW|nr:uncharacterized protein CONPUDRAFT_92780 [Coniophora puteana RWD-64-598 SS2]EIW76917.1 hypothetical protein CONPUDRAFT_92780 [Coniophora puteana RWD-64-598 SS2]